MRPPPTTPTKGSNKMGKLPRIRSLLDELRYDIHHLYLCWKERGKWQGADRDGEWTHTMSVWEVYRDAFIKPCPIYNDHLTGTVYGCYECQEKAHSAGWYDMDTGYNRR